MGFWGALCQGCFGRMAGAGACNGYGGLEACCPGAALVECWVGTALRVPGEFQSHVLGMVRAAVGQEPRARWGSLGNPARVLPPMLSK